MSKIIVDSLDENETDYRHFVWCSRDGVNDGTASDSGELAGATISSYTLTVTQGTVTISSDNQLAVTINYKESNQVVSYAANTVVTMLLTAASGAGDIEIVCRITVSDGRVLDQTMIIPIEEH